MGTGIRQIITTVLLFLLVLRPGISMSRDDRGAYLVVTLKDGQEVEGELLAVKQDSLLVLKRIPEEGVSIALVDIGKVKIAKKPKILLGGAAGFLAGAGIGALWGRSHAVDEDVGVFFGGVIFGGIGTVIGLVAGAVAGLDPVIVLAGRPEPEVRFVLSRLSRMSRNPGASAFLIREMAPSGGVIRTPTGRQSAPAVASPDLPRAARFRLTWAPGLYIEPEPKDRKDNVSFRLVDEPLPADRGPLYGRFSLGRQRLTFCPVRLSVAYEWSPHWSAEMELFMSGRYTVWRYASLYLPLNPDGTIDQAFVPDIREDSSSTCLLVGLAFRPSSPAVLRPHVLEAAFGVGPAWVRTTRRTVAQDWTRQDKSETRLAWTARARIAYEYYFTPAFGIGAFAEYRWLAANIPAFALTQAMEFWGEGEHFSRQVEFAFSGRKQSFNNFASGLRFTLRF